MTECDQGELLVVDDEPDLLSLFEAWLTERWSVRSATDGPTALELMDESVDLVVLDRRMAGMSGDDVLLELREQGYRCRVVFVSAAEPNEDILELSFDEYLVKPVTREELVGTVEALLNVSPGDQEARSLERLATKKRILEGHRDRAWDNNRQAIDRVTQELSEQRERLSDRSETYDGGIADDSRRLPDPSNL